MPTWKEYKSIAKERGALALELFVIESRLVGSPEDMQAKLPDHLAFQKKMEAEGKLVFAGPLSDDSGEKMSGAGMIVYRASSLDEAKAFAEADPMHISGIKTFTARSWLINEGCLSFTVKLSEQSIAFME